MRIISAVAFLIVLISFAGCGRVFEPDIRTTDGISFVNKPVAQQPESLANLSLCSDHLGNLWYPVVVPDTNATVPSESSSLPATFQLYTFNGRQHVLLYDNVPYSIEKIVPLDDYDFLLMNSKHIFQIHQNGTLTSLRQLGPNGLLMAIKMDGDKRIWAGGLGTGLLYREDEIWREYTESNSSLPNNSITAIHIDDQNDVWVATWLDHKITRIMSGSWDVMTPDIDELWYQIWDIEVDQSGVVWCGAGKEWAPVKLLRYDGNSWQIIYPKDESKSLVLDLVRHVELDAQNRLWIVSEKIVNNTVSQTLLAMWDGAVWREILPPTGDKVIYDLQAADKGVWISAEGEIAKVDY